VHHVLPAAVHADDAAVGKHPKKTKRAEPRSGAGDGDRHQAREKLEKVPASISTVSDTEIEEMGAGRLGEVMDTLPKVWMKNATSGTASSFAAFRLLIRPFIRRSAVVDDVSPAADLQQNLLFLDVERIESSRPQGTCSDKKQRGRRGQRGAQEAGQPDPGSLFAITAATTTCAPEVSSARRWSMTCSIFPAISCATRPTATCTTNTRTMIAPERTNPYWARHVALDTYQRLRSSLGHGRQPCR
jgi:hypothetical protein